MAAGRRAVESPGSAHRGGTVPLHAVLILAELIRVHSAAGAALAVWVGAHLAGARWSADWLLPMAVAFLLSAAGNADNDAHDAELDRLNRPGRPIPRGVVTPMQAHVVAAAAWTAALLCAFPSGLISALGTVAALGTTMLYTRHVKRQPLIGNGLVGGLAGMALGYGALLAGNVPAVLGPGVAMVTFFAGREVLKTVYDLPGDRAYGVPTAAILWGVGPTLRIVALLWGVTGGFITWVAGGVVGSASLITLAMVLMPVVLDPTSRHAAGRSLAWSKAAGLGALVAMLWL